MFRRSRLFDGLPLIAMPLLASCVAPQPAAPPRMAPPPPVTALPPPASHDWTDGPLTPGAWRYDPAAGDSAATFAPADAAPLFVLRCAPGSGVALVRPGAAGALTVTTTAGARTLQADAAGAARLAPRDPFLDMLAFSRGRFLVQTAGLPALVLPAQAEIGRIVEDCRG